MHRLEKFFTSYIRTIFPLYIIYIYIYVSTLLKIINSLSPSRILSLVLSLSGNYHIKRCEKLSVVVLIGKSGSQLDLVQVPARYNDQKLTNDQNQRSSRLRIRIFRIQLNISVSLCIYVDLCICLINLFFDRSRQIILSYQADSDSNNRKYFREEYMQDRSSLSLYDCAKTFLR